MIHLKPENYVMSTWSGGTTTQISIAPEGAVYADRDFLWRLSSATVDLEKSDFTALPDYYRYIATLEGEIDVIHNQGDPIHLTPYKVHAFDGGADTQSFGRCRDFNLMLRKGACDGLLEAVYAKAGETADVSPCDKAKEANEADMLIYLCEGKAKVEANGETAMLNAGEAVLVENAKNAAVSIFAEEAIVAMKAQIWR